MSKTIAEATQEIDELKAKLDIVMRTLKESKEFVARGIIEIRDAKHNTKDEIIRAYHDGWLGIATQVEIRLEKALAQLKEQP